MTAVALHALGMLTRRLATVAVQLWLIATLVFSVMYVMPGDPVMMLLGSESDPSPEAVAALRARLGLDQPVLAQYLVWMRQAISFDLGASLLNGYPVIDTIRDNLPRTLELALAAVLIAAVIGIPLGLLAALYHGKRLDTVLTSFATLGISLPVYILGALLILLFALELRWLPASGYMDISRNASEHFRRLALPAITLGFGLSASITRMTRSSVLDILTRDFVRTHRAKGMPEQRVIWRHVLRNAAIPIVAIIGLQLGNLMGGTVLVEAMFNWPGLSTALVDAIQNRNYPVVQGIVLTIAALYIFINQAVEAIYAVLDPRVRRRASP